MSDKQALGVVSFFWFLMTGGIGWNLAHLYAEGRITGWAWVGYMLFWPFALGEKLIAWVAR